MKLSSIPFETFTRKSLKGKKTEKHNFQKYLVVALRGVLPASRDGESLAEIPRAIPTTVQ